MRIFMQAAGAIVAALGALALAGEIASCAMLASKGLEPTGENTGILVGLAMVAGGAGLFFAGRRARTKAGEPHATAMAGDAGVRRPPTGDILVMLATPFAVAATMLPFWYEEEWTWGAPNLRFYRDFLLSFHEDWRSWLLFTLPVAALVILCVVAGVLSILRLTQSVRVRVPQVAIGGTILVLWAVIVLSPIEEVPYAEVLQRTFQGLGTWMSLAASILVVAGAVIGRDHIGDDIGAARAEARATTYACPSCGRDSTEAEQFCPGCGHMLPTTTAPAPRAEGEMTPMPPQPAVLDATDPPTREHVAVSTVAGLLGHEAPGSAAPATGAPDELSHAASCTLPDDGARRRWRRPGRRVVVAGAILAIALVGAGFAAYLQLTPERVTAPGLAANTSESLPTYAEVIDAYPSGARMVAIEADIVDYDVFADGTSIIDFEGEYRGVKISGGFYLTRDYRYDGSPGVLWYSYGDAGMPSPESDDWTAYEAFVHALTTKDKAFAALYDSTYDRMLGPRLTSWIAASIGELEVGPRDMLTFDASQRLVKVSAWSTPAVAPSVTPSPTASATPTPIASDTPGNITGVNKGSLPVKHITLFALYEGMSQAEIDAVEAYEMDIESHGSGAFTIRNVPPGTYVLMKTSMTTTKKSFQVLPGETVDIGTIHLDRP